MAGIDEIDHKTICSYRQQIFSQRQQRQALSPYTCPNGSLVDPSGYPYILRGQRVHQPTNSWHIVTTYYPIQVHAMSECLLLSFSLTWCSSFSLGAAIWIAQGR
eukprot:TRINITY_DN55382_c0_g1_i1.p1 TRINITY_DN55382_c0_g1~~TRINITY_DN55382_c0_g1_i1.p1  ORF type:complete len:104 (+),score=1.24 TRINITY_DN55382_c0_g1_i1:201-512(+)